jgi:hypothetical protein
MYMYMSIDTSMICVIPVLSYIGDTLVQISNNEQDYSTEQIYFSSVDMLNILQISPSYGPITGGTIINITTTTLSYLSTLSLVTCKFDNDNTIISIPFQTTNQYTLCVVPMSNSTGPITVELSINSQDYSTININTQLYSYVLPVQLTSISPNIGPIDGRTQVIVHATNIYNSSYELGLLKCKFIGGSGSGSDLVDSIVSGIYIDENIFSCVTPQVSVPDDISILITDNGQDYSQNNLTYQYILSTDYQPNFIFPNAGIINGGISSYHHIIIYHHISSYISHISYISYISHISYI